MVYLSVQLKGELLKSAQQRAEDEERTVTSLVRYALRQYLNAPAQPSKAEAGAVAPN